MSAPRRSQTLNKKNGTIILIVRDKLKSDNKCMVTRGVFRGDGMP